MKVKRLCLCAILTVLAAVHPANATEPDMEFFFADPILSDTEFIQQIVNATPIGGDCVIPMGEYTVSGIAVNHPMRLQGDGVTLRPMEKPFTSAAYADLKEQNFIFAVWSDDVTIEGFTFDSAEVACSVDIAHFYGDRSAVRGNTFITGQDGVRILSAAAGDYADECIIEENHFTTPQNENGINFTRLAGAKGGVFRNNTVNGEPFESAESVFAFAPKESETDPGEAVFVTAFFTDESMKKSNPSTNDHGCAWFWAVMALSILILAAAKRYAIKTAPGQI